jgi:PAS domain S-box-containing protein
LVDELRSWSEQAYIIIYTRSAAYGSARMAVNLGALAYLEGPEDRQELVKQVHRAIGLYLQRQAKQIEQAAAEMGLRLQMAIRAANVGLWDWDLQDDRIFFCPQWKGQLGYEEGQISDRPSEWFDRIHPQDWQKVLDALDGFIRSPGPELRLEYRLRHKDGSYRWILSQAAVLKDQQGKPIRLLGANVDITDRKRSEEVIAAALAFTKAIIQRAAEGICVFRPVGDPPGFIFSVWNAMMTRITGYQFDEIANLRLPEALFPTPDGHGLDWWARLLAGHELVDHEVDLVRKDGRQRTVRISSAIILDADGNRHILLVVRDITSLRLQQRKILNYQQQLRSLASQLTLTEERLRRELAIQIHDDISQLLAMAKLQLDGIDQLDQQALGKSIQAIREAVGQALEKTRSLTSQLSYPALRLLGLAKAVEKWLYEEVGAKAGLETVFVDDGRPKQLDKDVESVLFRSIREVLTNVTKHARAKRVVVSLHTGPDSLAVSIEDDGSGFDPAEVIPHSKGFGILSIQESVVRLGGSIQITSRPGAGCKVVLEVPNRNEQATKAG